MMSASCSKANGFVVLRSQQVSIENEDFDNILATIDEDDIVLLTWVLKLSNEARQVFCLSVVQQ